MIDDTQYQCRVCGHEQAQAPWNSDNEASYLICPCCGTEFGVDDIRFSEVLSRRNHWIDAGSKWFQPDAKPEGWNLNEQLGRIPEEWTLESLDIDPDKTAPRIDDERDVPSSLRQRWTPDYLDFYHFVAQAGMNGSLLPSDEQIDNFVAYFVEHYSYLQFYNDELDNEVMGIESGYGFFPHQRVVFFLNPYAGHFRTSSGAPEKKRGTIKDYADGVWQIDTDEYLTNFGLLDFRFVRRDSYRTIPAAHLNTLQSYLKYPPDLPEAFETKGSCCFSSFLNFDPSMFSKLTDDSNASKRSVFSKILGRLFGKSDENSESVRYQKAIREIIQNCDEKGRPSERASEVAREIQQYEREKLRQTLYDLREHYASYSATAFEYFQQNEEHYLRRIASEGASHFVAGIGFFMAYIPSERCAMLHDLEERNHATLDGQRVATFVSLLQYEEVVRLENRDLRMRKEYQADKELLENYFESVYENGEVHVFVKETYWSYKPEEKLTKIATLPAGSDMESIRDAMKRGLRTERYFSVCEFCWQRKPRIMMSDSDTCRSCQGQDEEQDDEEIVY